MYSCDNTTRRLFNNRTGGALFFLALLFALAIGLILGALFAQTLLPALAALIVFAAVIAAAIIAVIIYFFRRTE